MKMHSKFKRNFGSSKNIKQNYPKIPVIGNIVIPKEVGEDYLALVLNEGSKGNKKLQ